MLKVYQYDKCGTCRKALKFLDAQGVDYTPIPIREQPPSQRELQTMLKACDGNIRRLFNTSGQDYKALNMKDKLPSMPDKDAIALLGSNGNLVKRPFAIGDGVALTGFDETAWRDALL